MKAGQLKRFGEGVNAAPDAHAEDSDGFTKMSEKDNNPFEAYEQKPLPF
jgi:hypothetical protein